MTGAVALLVSLSAVPAPLHAAESTAAPDYRQSTSARRCADRTAISFPVRSITDSENVLLDDGREYNIGILTAGLDDEAARSALQDLVGGRSISIFSPQKGEPIGVDRYGRLRGDAMVPATRGKERFSLQESLVARGLARVTFDRPLVCSLQALLKAEEEARRRKLGHWASGLFSVLDANDAAAVAAHIGQFAIVEGQLRRTSKSRKGLYLNFGRNWRSDVTIFVPARLLNPRQTKSQRGGRRPGGLTAPPFSKKAGNTISNLGLKLRALPRLRARGWLDHRAGPMIEIHNLEQIEKLH
ncbi:MAG: hypothetical protein APF80_15600 [Alphaproteobacteria bacterium BRH_c36]|nr:MAG: hypothetical protein APF80_15600 [Alphaproteobacteria bacterium BRH_c36]